MIGLVIAGLSALSSFKSAKKQRKAAKTQALAVAAQNAKARQEAIKQYRAARSAVLSGAVASGADIRSSGYQGIKGSLQTQLQEEASYSIEQELFGAEVNKYQQQASKYATIGQAFAMGANIAQGVKDLRAQNQGPTLNTNTSPFISNTNYATYNPPKPFRVYP